MSEADTRLTPQALDRVPGWFWEADQRLFTWFLTQKAADEPPGDLLEMGAYMGKSAILMGSHLRPGEGFTVCDLFESDAPDESNNAETTRSYSTLTRRKFEENYLTFHETLPRIVHGPTSEVLDHVQPASCRFVHVDASHLYAHVRQDVITARKVLQPGGVVVFDDYRSEHTPGVAMAVWEAVANLDLVPICVTTQKLYGVWGDPAPLFTRLQEWLAATPQLWHTVDDLGRWQLLRVNHKKKPAPAVDAGTLKQISAELRRTSADLEKAVAESRAVTASLRRATADISLAGPIAQRAVRWTRRRLNRKPAAGK
ncbi:hypothetical protein Misp01_10490 [Microtetraspora sp. NBRC 13810]|uniref:class I SAM-dependent methyltransferase n=1 Tax=Microtetraspora sp. NBRC 13810 TaxID=3030990 RepID=UPI0024A12A8F|nr:class I SAM-dependent methyltransferase [Microtetraspora sp. NBRC 13810]GLW05919.1 hypothetical protein Misp01_10490 [Microtetraspora sp. NBRC 13810]